MTFSNRHVKILSTAKRAPVTYSSIHESDKPDYEYLIEKGYLEYQGQYKEYPDPGIIGYYLEPDIIVITQDGIAAIDTYKRDHIAVWTGIIIDFILGLSGFILGILGLFF